MSSKNKKLKSCTNCATAFQLTLNQPDRVADLKKYLKGIKHYQFSMAVKEIAPKTGHEHIHIYVQYSRSVRLSLKKIEGAHLEVCGGSAQQNIQYLKKHLKDEMGKLLWEEGEPEFKGKAQAKLKIIDVENMKKEDRKFLSINYYNIVDKINKQESLNLKISEFRKKVQVFYVWGPSGVGKTNWCLSKMEELKIDEFNDVKYTGAFWNGVTEKCSTALYDDFRDSHMKPSEFINFIDYNVHNLNIKGSFIKNKYEYIFITSVQDPEKLWREFQEKNPEDNLVQWIRRMQIIHLGNEKEEEKKFEKMIEDKKEEWQAFYHGSPDPLNNEEFCYDPFDLDNYK